MPEGPEIRRAADRLRAAVSGRPALDVYFAFPHLKPYEEILTGRRVETVEARGKAVLTRFADGWNVYSHNQLYGRWYVQEPGTWPKTRRTLRFAVHSPERSVLLYSASDIQVLHDDELSAHPYLAKLGPDPLDPATTATAIAKRARHAAFRRRSFAALLLDQNFVAGIGNYLRSEILFFARLHPRLSPAGCDRNDLLRLARNTLRITGQSYETGGITNRLGLVKKLVADGWTRRRYRHAVFGRDGKPCWRCSTEIEKVILASRRLYRCPTCQRRN